MKQKKRSEYSYFEIWQTLVADSNLTAYELALRLEEAMSGFNERIYRAMMVRASRYLSQFNIERFSATQRHELRLLYYVIESTTDNPLGWYETGDSIAIQLQDAEVVLRLREECSLEKLNQLKELLCEQIELVETRYDRNADTVYHPFTSPLE